MDNSVRDLLESYPEDARAALIRLRELILRTGIDHGLAPLEESLKWGEPSYAAKGGSAVRIDWKSRHPDKCFVLFQCQTKLVETFREIYGDSFEYEGNRAIVLKLSQDIPVKQLGHCISLSLRYHKLKHLPLLGA